MAKLGREDEGIMSEQVCFHAQQAVEKALKAVLLARQVDFPLVHDLEALKDIGQKAGITIPGNLLDIDTLTPYAVPPVGPGPPGTGAGGGIAFEADGYFSIGLNKQPSCSRA